jgi:hypothetical protein
MRITTLLIAFLPICSCASTGYGGLFGEPAPMMPLRPDGGIVHARINSSRVLCDSIDQIGDAAEIVLTIDQYYDDAASMLGYRNPKDVEIWLSKDWDSRFPAGTFADGIIVNPSLAGSGRLHKTLTHEFVHWHARSSPMRRNLPLIVMEGVCDWIALKLVCPSQVDFRAAHRDFLTRLASVRERGDFPLLISRLSLSKSATQALSSSDLADLYAMGFLLAERIGVDRLRAAAERGPVSSDEVLSWAGAGAKGQGLDLTLPPLMDTCCSDDQGQALDCASVMGSGLAPAPEGAVRGRASATDCSGCRDSAHESMGPTTEVRAPAPMSLKAERRTN